MKQIILIDCFALQKTIQEHKQLWLTDSLVRLGLSLLSIEGNDVEALHKNGIEILDHLNNGDMEILQNKILVGKWYSPIITAKMDENNKPYYEIELDFENLSDDEFNFSQ